VPALSWPTSNLWEGRKVRLTRTVCVWQLRRLERLEGGTTERTNDERVGCGFSSHTPLGSSFLQHQVRAARRRAGGRQNAAKGSWSSLLRHPTCNDMPAADKTQAKMGLEMQNGVHQHATLRRCDVGSRGEGRGPVAGVVPSGRIWAMKMYFRAPPGSGLSTSLSARGGIFWGTMSRMSSLARPCLHRIALAYSRITYTKGVRDERVSGHLRSRAHTHTHTRATRCWRRWVKVRSGMVADACHAASVVSPAPTRPQLR
jgi:hypothetical protein